MSHHTCRTCLIRQAVALFHQRMCRKWRYQWAAALFPQHAWLIIPSLSSTQWPSRSSAIVGWALDTPLLPKEPDIWILDSHGSIRVVSPAPLQWLFRLFSPSKIRAYVVFFNIFLYKRNVSTVRWFPHPERTAAHSIYVSFAIDLIIWWLQPKTSTETNIKVSERSGKNS